MCFFGLFFLFFSAFFLSSLPLFSQNEQSNEKIFVNYIINYKVEAFGSSAHQSTTPFWLHNNTEGLVPLEANNALLRGSVSGKYRLNRSLGVEAGIDLVGESKGIADETGSRSGAFFHQLYASIAFQALKLTAGAKTNYHSILDRSLSSGDFAFSANARPIPEINLQVSDFTTIPYTKDYLQFKGDFALGRLMDDGYIRTVKTANAPYAQRVLLHHKSVFFLIKEPSGKVPVRLILGVEDCAQWGGWNSRVGNLPQSFSDFLRVIAGSGGGEDAPTGEQINRLGNHLGTYSLYLGYRLAPMELAVYKQHYFEDNSGMEYANWRDGIWGFECRLFNQPILQKVVLEYVQTTNQSGPFHFPFLKQFPPGMKARIGGGDSYYNHGFYSAGWSYFGRAIGNPLLTSPEYNTNGALGFRNNRIKALHGGVQGSFLSDFSYRILGTIMHGYGTMARPFLKRIDGLSGLLECTYTYPKRRGWELGVQLAADKGSFYGSNLGVSLRLAKTGDVVK